MATNITVDSLSILTETETGKAQLAVAYNGVIENLFSQNISHIFRNMNLSGNPSAGSVIVRRLPFTTAGKIGDARKAGKGQAVSAEDIVIALDNSWEYINEVSEADVQTFGVAGLVERKANDNVMNAAKDVEVAFWAEAIKSGSKVDTSAPTLSKKIDAAIVAIESTKTKYVRGVKRDNLGVVLTPASYTELQSEIDLIHNPLNGNRYEYFHNVPVYCSTDLPDGIEVVVIGKDAIAQPTLPLTPPAGRVPFSNDYFFGTSGIYGTKAVLPELIKYIGNPVSSSSAEPDGSST